MTCDLDPALLGWLLSNEVPPVRYLTSRHLVMPRPSAEELHHLHHDVLDWEPLRRLLALQRDDGSFPPGQKTPTAQPTLSALALMARCGLGIEDEPVRLAVDHLTTGHLGSGGLSYTSGGSGVLPCYQGVTVAALVKMGALDTELVETAIDWLVDHQRFDHKATRAGGEKAWPYKAPQNYGCWDSVSCYHGVAGAFRAFAAIPPERRSDVVTQRLGEAIEYLRVHRLYKRTTADRPLVRHLTQFFLVGDYRSDLLDMLQGLADADPALGREGWVRDALDDMAALTDGGRVTLVKNYGRKLMDPIPFEPVGEPSRFLTLQWLCLRDAFERAGAGPPGTAGATGKRGRR